MGRDTGKDLERGTAVKLIAIASELNYVLQHKGLQAEKGLLFLAGEGGSVGYLIYILRYRLDAVEVTNLKKRESIRNYQIGFHEFTKYDREEDLRDFLDCTDFFPVVIVKDIVPEVLKGMAFLVRISERLTEEVDSQEFSGEINSIRQFVRENPELVTEELDKIRTSRRYLGKSKKTSFFVSLLAATQVYYTFFRREHNEEETNFEQARLVEEIIGIEDECLSYEGVDEAAEAIKNSVLRYFGTNGGWEIADVDHVDDWTDEAVKDGNAILHDKNFYYISEPLFRMACNDILNIISFIEVKKILLDEDKLCCNKGGYTNYTVKKVYTKTDGKPDRGRFLKIRKDFLTFEDGLYLEEKKGYTYAIYR